MESTNIYLRLKNRMVLLCTKLDSILNFSSEVYITKFSAKGLKNYLTCLL